MSGFFRTSDKTANTLRRKIVPALGTSATTNAVPLSVAHGMTGPEHTILTIAIDGSYGTNPVLITCQYWSTFANQWLFAGAGTATGTQSVSMAPGGTVTFVLPESSLYFLYGDSAVDAGFVYTDGLDAPLYKVPNAYQGT